MHIVVLTGSYYPYLMPPAACIKPYLDELAKIHHVEVVAPSTDSRYVNSVECDGVTVHYINSLSNRLLTYIEEGVKKRHISVLFSLFKFAYRGARFIKYSLGRSPYETSLIKPYVKELGNIHQHKKIDVIISVTFPYYTHVAAFLFKKNNPDVRWVTYSTDPLAHSEANPIGKSKMATALKIESDVYNSCDKCIVTEELLPNLINEYNVPRDKIVVLSYLLKDMPVTSDDNHHDRPVILYAGYVFYKVRNPKKMLSVFSLLPELKLNLYIAGDRHCRSILSKSYPDNIVINGLVSRKEYYNLLSCADVLILLSNDAKLQAPSKLTELISTGKPIINFYYHKDSGFQMIENYPLGLNVSNAEEDNKVAKEILMFVNNVCSKRLDKEEVWKLYPDRLLSTQMPLFLDALG